MSLLHYIARSLEKRWPDHVGAVLKEELKSLDQARQGMRSSARSDCKGFGGSLCARLARGRAFVRCAPANMQGIDIEIADLRRGIASVEKVCPGVRSCGPTSLLRAPHRPPSAPRGRLRRSQELTHHAQAPPNDKFFPVMDAFCKRGNALLETLDTNLAQAQSGPPAVAGGLARGVRTWT